MNRSELLKPFIDRLQIEEEDNLDEGLDLTIGPSTLTAESLEEIYKQIPLRFSKLYEKLLLTYHWPDAEIDECCFYGCTTSGGWQGLVDKIKRDQFLFDTCVKANFLPFGKGADYNYDPLCFDLNECKKGEPAIVMLYHEAILCYEKVQINKKIARNFEQFIRERCLARS